jgi:hypothetical protein
MHIYTRKHYLDIDIIFCVINVLSQLKRCHTNTM